jgi:hypothetical protein
MDSQDLSNTAPSPSRTPSQVIAGADRNLAASIAQLEAIKTYLVAAGEASGSSILDLNDFTCSFQTLLEPIIQTVEDARAAVQALAKVGFGTVTIIRPGAGHSLDRNSQDRFIIPEEDK